MLTPAGHHVLSSETLTASPEGRRGERATSWTDECICPETPSDEQPSVVCDSSDGSNSDTVEPWIRDWFHSASRVTRSVALRSSTMTVTS